MSLPPDDEPTPPPRFPPPRLDSSETTRKLRLSRAGPGRKVVVPTLRVVAGRDMLRFVTLHAADEVVIGRDENGSLVLTDASVSRRHARVSIGEDGSILVHDLGSTNGTAVNGQPIERSLLRPGDHLEIGAVSLRLDILSLEEVSHLENVLSRLEAGNRDPLTGLMTRAYIDEELPPMLDRSGRANVDVTALFFDVDSFKAVNDRHGHPVGDDVLVGVARLLMVGVRDTDPCVRYGGEEFVLFLQGSNEEAGAEVADRIRRSIQGHDWTRTAPGLRVTASCGVAQWEAGQSIKDWIGRADRALFVAKGSGRNRVERASTLSEPVLRTS
jgi:diguanylate cyclase (GGDEF)-like protein